MLLLGDRVLDTRFRPAVLTPVADVGAAQVAVDDGADVVELPAGSTAADVREVAPLAPVAVEVDRGSDVGELVSAGVSLLVAGADEAEVRAALPAGSAVAVMGPGQVLDLVGASPAEQCARIAALPGTGCRAVRTADPSTARRAADLVEALERESAGVFP